MGNELSKNIAWSIDVVGLGCLLCSERKLMLLGSTGSKWKFENPAVFSSIFKAKAHEPYHSQP